jgi:hypothetical protein
VGSPSVPRSLAHGPTGWLDGRGFGVTTDLIELRPRITLLLRPGDGVENLIDGAWAEYGIGLLEHDQLLAMVASTGHVDASIE